MSRRPIPADDLASAAGTISGCRAVLAELVSEMVFIVRHIDNDDRARVGAAVAAGILISRVPAIAQAEHDIEAIEQARAAAALGYNGHDLFAAVHRSAARQRLTDHATAHGVTVIDSSSATDGDDY